MSFWRRRRREEELSSELEAHLRMAVADRVARGESPASAEAAARRELGNLDLIKDVTRETWGGGGFERPSPVLMMTCVLSLVTEEAATARGVVSDSRAATPGCAFVALKGDFHDGHEYVDAAVSAGAVLLVLEAERDDVRPPVDVVRVGRADAQKSRLKTKTSDGTDVVISLDRGTRLRDGDVLLFRFNVCHF